MIKVLVGRSELRMTGPSFVVLKGAQLLVEHGHEVDICCPGGELVGCIAEHRSSYINVPGLSQANRSLISSVRAILTIAKQIKQKKYDVLHGHNAHTTLVFAIAKFISRSKAKLVTTVHGVGKEWIYRYMPVHIIAVSSDVKMKLIKSRVKDSKVTVIHNSIVRNPENNLDKLSINTDDSICFVNVASMIGNKGHVRLIRCFSKAICQSHGYKLKLYLIGDGPSRPYLESLVKELGCSEFVIFLGSITNAINYLNQFDVFIHVPDYETFGIVVLEAMATKLPVITTAVGGIPEIIDDNIDGVLVNLSDASIIEAIERLAVNSKEREKYSLNGFKKFERSFSTETYIDKVLKVYQRV